MVKIYAPPVIDYAKRYYFDFRAQDKTGVNRINFDGGKYSVSDTTAVNTNSTTYVTVKTYTYDTTGKPTPRKLRVRVYANCSTSGDTMYVRIVVDGTPATEVSTTSTTEILIGDWLIDINAGSHTVNVQARSAIGQPVYVTKVYLIDCYAITSTTPVSIASFTFNPADEYSLSYKGDFKFEVGNRFRINVTYYRKTTAASTISTVDKSFSIASGDDGNTVDGVSSAFYATTSLSNSTFDMKVNVGASGDVIWIISLTLMVQVTLRGNQTDKYGNFIYWQLVINVNGVGIASSWSKSINGTIIVSCCIYQPSPTGHYQEFAGVGGTDVKVYNVAFNVYDTKAIVDTKGYDYESKSVCIRLIVQVVG